MTHTSAETRESPTSSPSSGALRALRTSATVTVLVLAYQFVTAGQILSHNRSAGEFHGGGAIVLHVVAGVTTLAAAAHWRLRGAPAWPAVLAALVFVLSFAQAYFGEHRALWLHVPGALMLTVGAVAVTAWSFTRAARL